MRVPSLNEFPASLVAILADAAPYLLLGFALAGVLHVVLARFPGITARLTRPGRRSVLYGALIGVPMPLCSCSVLPAAMALRRDGASRGATASFLVSVPETDVVSILITYALIGPVMAVYRPLAAICSALATGIAVEASPASQNERVAVSAQADACCDDACAAPTMAKNAPWWKRALRYGFVEIFDDIILQLLLGIAIAALLGVWLPQLHAGAASVGVAWQYLVMAAIGIPMYVCATASTPVAAGFIMGGVSPGAALVFLLAGPATNVASLVVLRAAFGVRFLVVYLVSIAATSVAAGVLFDRFAGDVVPRRLAGSHAHDGVTPLQAAAIIVFLLLAVVSLWRIRALQRAAAGLRRLTTRASER